MRAPRAALCSSRPEARCQVASLKTRVRFPPAALSTREHRQTVRRRVPIPKMPVRSRLLARSHLRPSSNGKTPERHSGDVGSIPSGRSRAERPVLMTPTHLVVGAVCKTARARVRFPVASLVPRSPSRKGSRLLNGYALVRIQLGAQVTLVSSPSPRPDGQARAFEARSPGSTPGGGAVHPLLSPS